MKPFKDVSRDFGGSSKGEILGRFHEVMVVSGAFQEVSEVAEGAFGV